MTSAYSMGIYYNFWNHRNWIPEIYQTYHAYSIPDLSMPDLCMAVIPEIYQV